MSRAADAAPPTGSFDAENGDNLLAHAKTFRDLQSTIRGKWKVSRTGNCDTALALFKVPDELHDTLEPGAERALQRKIDFMILLIWLYAMRFFILIKPR